MKSREAIQDDEERIRKLVRELPDEMRLQFFREAEKRLKDPDTYAALNFFFVAGLHHFYLGEWLRGTINLFLFFAGVVLLLTGWILPGVLLLIFICMVELKALFQSQLIVQRYNNEVMKALYRKIAAPHL